jgi:hypothetical protein
MEPCQFLYVYIYKTQINIYGDKEEIKMYRKVIGVLTAIVLIATVFTACGRSASTSATAPQAASNSASKSSASGYAGAVGAADRALGDNGAAETDVAPASAEAAAG